MQSLQVHQADAEDSVDTVPCTQVPIKLAKTTFKRLRMDRQCKAKAAGVGELTPRPPSASRSKKKHEAVGGLADLSLQTPMPESEAANVFGPPPPPSTPTVQRGNPCSANLIDSGHATVHVAVGFC